MVIVGAEGSNEDAIGRDPTNTKAVFILQAISYVIQEVTDYWYVAVFFDDRYQLLVGSNDILRNKRSDAIFRIGYGKSFSGILHLVGICERGVDGTSMLRNTTLMGDPSVSCREVHYCSTVKIH